MSPCLHCAPLRVATRPRGCDRSVAWTLVVSRAPLRAVSRPPERSPTATSHRPLGAGRVQTARVRVWQRIRGPLCRDGWWKEGKKGGSQMSAWKRCSGRWSGACATAATGAWGASRPGRASGPLTAFLKRPWRTTPARGSRGSKCGPVRSRSEWLDRHVRPQHVARDRCALPGRHPPRWPGARWRAGRPPRGALCPRLVPAAVGRWPSRFQTRVHRSGGS